MSTLDDFPTLIWTYRNPCWNATWPTEFNLDRIRDLLRTRLGLASETTIEVSFHAQGTYNKNYLINIGNEAFMFRIASPIWIPDKTASEVATMKVLAEIVSSRVTIGLMKLVERYPNGYA
jgi:hypothetical protein